MKLVALIIGAALIFAGCPEIAPEYAVTVVDTVNGSIEANPVNAKAGGTVILIINPASNYALDSLSVQQTDGTEVPVTGSGNTRRFSMPSSDVTVSGGFVLVPGGIYQLTITNSAHGFIMATPDELVRAGTSVFLDIVPDSGYYLENLTVQTAGGIIIPVTVSGISYTFTMPDAPVTVTGEFAPIAYTVHIIAGTTGGTVTANPPGGAAGTAITLIIDPDDGYGCTISITDAQGSELPYTTTGDTYTFVMPASDVTVTVEFEAI